ncbi:MAG: filamentous hemagglutinin N-terminal domain-containing protein [Symploca sp. SIO2D2]|nr:filamentous hemagglutinin N-terminal domain-containing protein [Symploca sp. SIO2D2]
MVNQLWYKSLGLASWLTIFLILPFNQYRVLAQLTPDTTLGAESSRVTPNVEVRGGPADLIEGGAGRGANLFHSFGQFNVQELQRVYFANPVGIENILTRVTGADPSNIFGTLGVDGAANLYLLNPHGILFGANAQLDVEGSFVGSTANALTFEDGSSYSAANPGNSSVLTIRVPLGLQYGTNQTGAITNRGNLSAGQDLTLSAGNLDLQGQLLAGKDLTLEAQDTVQIRDSGTVPFIAAAREQLLVQGKEAVDIFALNHPDSGLFSGGDMLLRSASPVLGDAHYWSGGSFRIEQLDGSLGGLESPNDPVIRTVGDVLIGGYIGASLHIIAGGKVEIPGFIQIIGADPTNGLQENVTLSDGTTIAIDGTIEPTLDIRAGVDPAAIRVPFFSGTGNDLFFAPADFPITPTSADITIGVIRNNGGKVFLTNQYQPNVLLDTPNGITVGSIDTRDFFGGDSVVIDSRGSITLNGTVNVSAFPFFGIFFGDGGDVKLIAEGDINLNQGANIFSQGLWGGNITFNSNGDISIVDSLIESASFTNVAGATEGDIQVTANSLFLTEGARLTTATFGVGDAGVVKITATDLVQLDGEGSDGIPSAIFSQVGSGAEGKSQGIELTTASLELLNGARVDASTGGIGDAGAVKIIATDSVRLDGEGSDGIPSAIFSQVGSGAEGKSQGIELTTSSLELTNGARVDASSVGVGNAGAVKINAIDSVQLDGESSNGFSSGVFSVVAPGAEGNSEGIELTTASLKLTNGARVNASTRGIGNSGALKITATDSVRLDGESSNGFSSAISSRVDPEAEGNSGGIELTTASLELTNGADLNASTEGVGNAGAVKITATDSVRLDGEGSDGIPSAIFSQVAPGAEGNSGRIELTTSFLRLTNGARVSASTLGGGHASDIFVRNAQSVFLDNNSSISTAVEPTSRGTGGDIDIQTNSLTLEDNSRISAQSQAPGRAGDINLNVSETLTATDSDITTSSTQSAGGAINIIAKDIRLRGDSDITTSVFSGADNGGNITITTDSLIAFADSDILAFARDGRGGDITFLTPIFFGFAFRPAPKGTDPATLDLNNRVDINASGAIDGVITLPNLDFITNSLTELQDNLIDTDSILANSCIVRTKPQESTFTITGGGNLYQIRFTEYPYNERVKYCYIALSCLDQYTWQHT